MIDNQWSTQKSYCTMKCVNSYVAHKSYYKWNISGHAAEEFLSDLLDAARAILRQSSGSQPLRTQTQMNRLNIISNLCYCTCFYKNGTRNDQEGPAYLLAVRHSDAMYKRPGSSSQNHLGAKSWDMSMTLKVRATSEPVLGRLESELYLVLSRVTWSLRNKSFLARSQSFSVNEEDSVLLDDDFVDLGTISGSKASITSCSNDNDENISSDFRHSEAHLDDKAWTWRKLRYFDFQTEVKITTWQSLTTALCPKIHTSALPLIWFSISKRDYPIFPQKNNPDHSLLSWGPGSLTPPVRFTTY